MQNKPRQSIKLFECFAEVLPVISKRSLGRIDAPERAFQM